MSTPAEHQTNPNIPSQSPYIGRFAPSPTGPLHFGSLVSALASYLDAKSHHGRWLVRIEDIDPPREEAGAADTILRQLEQHGLCWDGEVLFQHTRSEAYRDILQQLQQRELLYPCTCSRQILAESGGIHPAPCRKSAEIPRQPFALRLRVESPSTIVFDDLFQRQQRQNISHEVGDFVLLRKDGLFAYQLAVVADEAAQQITHVIRGADLLESTPRQIYLQQLLGFETPEYGHIPVAVDRQGEKLSKQNLAPSLDEAGVAENLVRALLWLGLPVPELLRGETPPVILAWAIPRWDRELLVGQIEKPAC